MWSQATNIPFENLATLYPSMRIVRDSFGNEEMQRRSQIRNSLDPGDIYRKLVCSNRGGFCFEQNLLLARALRGLGFRADPISSRGVVRASDDTNPHGYPLSCFTHLVLIVTLADGHATWLTMAMDGLVRRDTLWLWLMEQLFMIPSPVSVGVLSVAMFCPLHVRAPTFGAATASVLGLQERKRRFDFLIRLPPVGFCSTPVSSPNGGTCITSARKDSSA